MKFITKIEGIELSDEEIATLIRYITRFVNNDNSRVSDDLMEEIEDASDQEENTLVLNISDCKEIQSSIGSVQIIDVFDFDGIDTILELMRNIKSFFEHRK